MKGSGGDDHATADPRPAAVVAGLRGSRDLRDDGGSSQPDDDLDYASLKDRLASRFSKVQDLRLDVVVRRIEFDDDVKRARVTYSYTMSFKVPEYSGRAQTENDIKQMLLKRVGDQEWKITSGI